jgi:hypothetical protein
MSDNGPAGQRQDTIDERVRRKAREIAVFCEEACGMRHITAEGLTRAAMFAERRYAIEECAAIAERWSNASAIIDDGTGKPSTVGAFIAKELRALATASSDTALPAPQENGNG